MFYVRKYVGFSILAVAYVVARLGLYVRFGDAGEVVAVAFGKTYDKFVAKEAK